MLELVTLITIIVSVLLLTLAIYRIKREGQQYTDRTSSVVDNALRASIMNHSKQATIATHDIAWILRVMVRLLQAPKLSLKERKQILAIVERYTTIIGSQKLEPKLNLLNACVTFWTTRTKTVAKRKRRTRG